MMRYSLIAVMAIESLLFVIAAALAFTSGSMWLAGVAAAAAVGMALYSWFIYREPRLEINEGRR